MAISNVFKMESLDGQEPIVHQAQLKDFIGGPSRKYSAYHTFPLARFFTLST